jgi:hypothetical protein
VVDLQYFSLRLSCQGLVEVFEERLNSLFHSSGSAASRSATVPTAAGTFSPQRPLLRRNGHGYSPAVLPMVVEAAGRLPSFADAAFALHLTRQMRAIPEGE